jgi:hypothetical protein
MIGPNSELNDWITEWQRGGGETPARGALRHYVRRRSRTLVTWIVGESIVAIAGIVILTYFFLTRPDPVERIVMGTLSLACAVALVFGWWNWRGSLRAIGESTTVYLDLSTSRLMRWRRAIIGGWILLAVEMAAFIPWVWYRTYALPPAERGATVWPWALLLTVGAIAVVWLITLARWVGRESLFVEQLRRECREQ